MDLTINSLQHIGIPVSDMAKSEAIFCLHCMRLAIRENQEICEIP